MTQTKTCTKCSQTKSLSEFHNEKRGKYGKTSRCKTCVSQLSKSYKFKPKKYLSDDELKQCTKCLIDKPASNFSKHSGNSDGLATICKYCKSIQDAEYRKNNKENKSIADKKYYQDNKEKHQKNCKQWRIKNSTYYADHQRIYRQNNKDKLALTKKQYIATPKGKAVRKASHQKRKALLRNVVGKYKSSDILKLFELQSNKCVYCKKDIDSTIRDGYHIDHVIPLNKNGTNNPDNLQLLCVTCNCSKQDKLPEEFAQQFGMLL